MDFPYLFLRSRSIMNGKGLYNRCHQSLHYANQPMSSVRNPTMRDCHGEEGNDSAFRTPVLQGSNPTPESDIIPESGDPKTPKAKRSCAPSRPCGVETSLRRCAPSLWSCGVVVGLVFCLFNEQVNAIPLRDTQLEKR